MFQALQLVHAQAVTLFAATILLIVFFLIARVAQARQPIALAFAMMPLLLMWAVQGAASPAAVF